MIKPVRPTILGQSEQRPRGRWRVPVSIAMGSLATILPIVATVPILPPFGLMMMLGWRLRRSDALPPWSAALFGLFDDLVSGQPLGSAMLLWTMCFLAIDVIDTRLVWRDFWHDWLIASGAIAFCLIAGRLLASSFGAHVDTVMLFQIVVAAAFFPLIVRLCAILDVKREPE